MTTTLRVAVLGATGAVGRHVVDEVRRAGSVPVLLSRATGVDVVTGTGLAAALDGVDAVVDVSNVRTTATAPAVAFFEAAARTLLDAARDRDVRHVVALSIVGIDGFNTGYYLGKRRQETQLLQHGDGRVSVLRATQFHEFVPLLLSRVPPTRGPVAVLPALRMQPVAAREVAAALVALASGPPRGRADDLAGPREEELPALARRWLRAQGRRRWVLGVRVPGRTGRAMASGALLPAGPGPRGTLSFDDWLRAEGTTP